MTPSVHRCESCDYSTVCRKDFNRHTAIHSDLRPFQCHLCDYTAKRKVNLRQHMEKHQTERPHKCPMCDFTGKTLTSIQLHMQVHETRELQFQCDLCEFQCFRKGSLEQHMLFHSPPERKCTQCDYTATQESTLKRHIKTRHKVTGEEIICSRCSPDQKSPKVGDIIILV